MNLHYFQHVPFEDPAYVLEWAARQENITLSKTALYDEHELPAQESIDALLVMGGPMSVHDREQYGWLNKEMRFIEEAMKAEIPVLGICLGAQLIATICGAPVRKNREKEIGWFPVTLSEAASLDPVFHQLPTTYPAFHWHGETFDIPAGATLQASSDACVNQAFSIDSTTLALQYHLESTPTSVENLIVNCAGEITEGKFIQKPERMRDLTRAHYSRANALSAAIMNAFFAS